MPSDVDDETVAAALKALQGTPCSHSLLLNDPPTAKSPEESEAALREFNALKYRKLTEGQAKKELMVSIAFCHHCGAHALQKHYPEPPLSGTALDAQQRALLHEQEREINKMNVRHVFRIPFSCM